MIQMFVPGVGLSCREPRSVSAVDCAPYKGVTPTASLFMSQWIPLYIKKINSSVDCL